MAFTATNTSNATIDIFVATEYLIDGDATAHGGIDSFNPAFKGYFADTNGNLTYDAGVDQELLTAHLDEVLPDTSRTYFAIFDIPPSLPNAAVAGMNIYALAREGGEVGVRGVGIAESYAPDTAGVDTVFADGAGPGNNTARDGKVSIGDDITISAAMLSIIRSRKVIENLVEGTTNPKAIPGATVEYCLQISNAAGAARADAVTVSDTLGAELTYSSAYGIYQGGSVTGGECNADGTTGGTFNAGIVKGTIASIAAGETKTIRYRATVN